MTTQNLWKPHFLQMWYFNNCMPILICIILVSVSTWNWKQRQGPGWSFQDHRFLKPLISTQKISVVKTEKTSMLISSSSIVLYPWTSKLKHLLQLQENILLCLLAPVLKLLDQGNKSWILWDIVLKIQFHNTLVLNPWHFEDKHMISYQTSLIR